MAVGSQEACITCPEAATESSPDPRLLREGIEALLIVVGTIACRKKAGREEVLRHVHAGWIGALAAGGLTWAVAAYVVGISGASREVTESASSLFAAVVLLGVGVWMHQKSSAGRWQACLRDKLSTAVSPYALTRPCFTPNTLTPGLLFRSINAAFSPSSTSAPRFPSTGRTS